MNSRMLIFVLGVAASIAVAAHSARAVSIEDLFGGGELTIGDKIFSDWTLLEAQTTGGGLLDVSMIDVVPLADDPLNPGVKFNAPLGALGTPFGHVGPASVTLRFGFSVQQTTDGPPLIKDNSLLLNGFIFDAGPDAVIRISETVNDAAGNRLGDKSVFAESFDQPNSGDPDHFDSADFDPQSIVFVEKLIDIQGPGDNDGAFLTMFEQRFSQVPEPSGLVILSGLLICAAAGRTRRHR